MAKKEKEAIGSLESLIESMNTTFKDGDFAIALEKDFISKLEWLSSGNYAINFACTGSPYKAIPFGRIVSFVGDAGSGKSLLANHFLAENQKIGGISVLFDVERANYIQQLNKLGIDSTKLIISGSKILEDIFEKSIAFVKAYQEKKMTAPLVIVIDSLSQASSRHEMEEGFDKSDMKRAQVIRKGLRMISGLISDNKVCLIIINHQTSSIGNPYGPSKVTTGGCFTPGVKVLLANNKYKNIEDIEEGEEVITHTKEKHKVLKKWVYEDKSELINITLGKDILTVTPEHKLLVTENDKDVYWLEAKNLTIYHSIVKF